MNTIERDTPQREQHRTHVISALHGEWKGRCSCGWSSKWQDSRSAAEKENESHVTYMASAGL